MKTIRIISSPGTEFKIVEEKTIYAPADQVYFMQDNEGLVFAKTQEQSEEYIKRLEKQLADARQTLDAIMDVLMPNRDDYVE
jgi:hypothetical protein